MSRVANNPIKLPKGVDLKINGSQLNVKGPKGNLDLVLHESVSLAETDNEGEYLVTPENDKAVAMAGTFRALVNNMVVGVSEGFEKKLQLVGVGFRAQLQGNTLNLALGFSHPVEYPAPEGITLATPSQTEIVVSGCDKQRVGQVASEIRAYRPPEPYKGKGVRYADERVVRKEAKKA
jgi:large subunit ribosomal protein L6